MQDDGITSTTGCHRRYRHSALDQMRHPVERERHRSRCYTVILHDQKETDLEQARFLSPAASNNSSSPIERPQFSRRQTWQNQLSANDLRSYSIPKAKPTSSSFSLAQSSGHSDSVYDEKPRLGLQLTIRQNLTWKEPDRTVTQLLPTHSFTLYENNT